MASASAFFQKTMDLILQGVPHVACYIDDILITGANQQARAFAEFTRSP